MAELHTCLPKRRRPKGGVLSFGAGAAGESEEVAITLDDYASLFLKLGNGARGNFTTCQAAAGRKVDIEIQVFGSKESYAWSHVHPNALWIGHREKANEVFYESSQQQCEDTRKYATLPTGHPMGYHDAVLNLFRDYYEAAGGQAGRPALRGGLPRLPDRPRDDVRHRRRRPVGQVGRVGQGPRGPDPLDELGPAASRLRIVFKVPGLA